ncbi:MAG: penicillin-binding protein 2 [Desulfobacterales bacterium]|jgi:cell division protein FtsI (penicillin-binding protein 3)|nr:penicillin-binding protein 2 [Desulfobacterales bacterium]
MKRTRNDPIKRRIVVVGVLMSLWFAAVGGRAVYLQAFHGDWLSQRASNQYERTYEQQAKRGTIFDRNFREMALSVDATSIGANPGCIQNRVETASALAGALNLDGKELIKRLSSKSPFVWVERQITPRETESVMALSLPGIAFRQEHQRFYPSRTLAAQVMGFVGIDGRGLEGIEFRYEQDLKGDTRRLTVLKDALGKGFSPGQADPLGNCNVSENAEALVPAGNNVVLTIDRTIQYVVEEALAEAVQKFDGKSGIAIVMSPSTGAVLALAHYPFFNPNAYANFPKEILRNRAITDPFEPGSTLKMFTAAAALEHGGLTPETQFFCENGSFRVGRHTIRDTHPHERLTLQEIVQVSSNIGAAKVGARIGASALHTTLKDFGFGEKTGIDCPGESNGFLLPFDRWTPIDACAIAFGQGVSVSVVQLVTAVSAIANDGMLMKPYIVEAITDAGGRLVKRFSPQKVRQAVSPGTARAVARMLETVTREGGTAKEAAIEGYRIAGKTGTAQKVDGGGGYARGKYIASFVGFFPVAQPMATILVMVDEPKKVHYGGLVAAPAFRKIALELINYMHPETGRPEGGLTASLKRGVRG